MSRSARLAGLVYLVVVLTGIFSLAYVPSRLSGHGDASAAVANIVAHENLFRMGIAAGLLCYSAFLVLPLALYRILSPFGKSAAALMVAFAVTEVPIALTGLAHRLDVLSLLDNAAARQVFTANQVHEQALLSLQASGNVMLVGHLFSGLWLLPFGFLVFKSGILPRVLGILLMAGCFGYLVDVLGTIAVPGYGDWAIANYVILPASVGEIGTCLWLLVMGAKQPSVGSANAAA